MERPVKSKGGRLYVYDWRNHCHVWTDSDDYGKGQMRVRRGFGLFYFWKGEPMRYHYEKPDIYSSMYGATYACDHPIYNKCTLFHINNRGLAVIQQRYDP